jgi:hypothetical protein
MLAVPRLVQARIDQASLANARTASVESRHRRRLAAAVERADARATFTASPPPVHIRVTRHR